MKIYTERLLIRPFNKHDLMDTLIIYSNPKTCKYLLHDSWNTKNVDEKFGKKIRNNSLTKSKKISLACVFQNKVIGDISVWYTGIKDTVEIGFVFSDKFTGQGFANEAVLSVINYLFYKQNVHRIQACLDAQNISSSKLCRRLGMRKEAILVKAFWKKGVWVDVVSYGMLESDLELLNFNSLIRKYQLKRS